jgi:beta-1,4-N-acetylglucosaminyltransferase
MVIVLGSGGHSGEMVNLLRDIDPLRYKHRTYVVSSGDSISAHRAEDLEKVVQQKYLQKTSHPSKSGDNDPKTGIWDIRVVPRAREIHQPLYRTPLSALRCLIGCFVALREISQSSTVAPFEYPDVIITNGPATAVMFILAGLILKMVGVAPASKMKTVYVESFARVRTLSLSGKVLLYLGLCDRFLVQWQGLADELNGHGARKRVEYYGFLV